MEKHKHFYVYETYKTIYTSLDWDNSGMTQIISFLRRSCWKLNFLPITEERKIYLITSISKQCMESYQFPSNNTVISVLLNDVNNSKRQNLDLSWFILALI